MLFKGIFWYVPSEKNLICVKVKCDANGISQENVEYSSKSGENFNHKTEWEKLSKSIKGNHPYNYYPRGRVEVKNNKATIYLNPDLNRIDICNLIIDEFALNDKSIKIKFVFDGSNHYDYLIDFYPTKCTMCGKDFEEWDYQENISFDHLIGYGSKYDCSRLKLDLCINCFDKVIDFILPQCKINPLSDVHIPN